MESNDEQRIREIQEVQRRDEKRLRTADNASRTERSFQESLRSRTKTDRARHHEKTDERREGEISARQVLDQVRKRRSELPHERARRAAMARALHGKGALEARTKASLGDARIQSDRADEALQRRGAEWEHVDETTRDQEIRESDGREERVDAARQDAEQTQIQADADGRREPRQEHPRDRDDRPPEERAAAVQETKAQGAAGAPRVPHALIQRITATLTKVVEDGRTRLRVRLKSPGLEGVELEVQVGEDGIHCAFSGCSDRLRRDLEAAEDGLREALEDRGLQLGRLEVR